MELKRSCSLIHHPTSLPGPFGIGTPSGNWERRLTAGMLTQDIAGRLSDLADLYGRKAGGK